jgi:hypothetical protein
MSGRLSRLAVAATGLLAAAYGGSVWGAFDSRTTNAGNSISASADLRAPTASASVIGKAQGGVPGFIHQGGSFNVYASVADAGSPASGTSSVTADVSAVSIGQSAAPLAAGSFAIGGSSYNRRSAGLSAKPLLAEGTYGYSIQSTDAAGNARTQTGFTVVVDNTAPAGADVQAQNRSGGIAGKPEAGDTLTLTYSEPLDPGSVVSGWAGSSTSVVVHIDDNTLLANDGLTVYNASNSSALPLGAVNLGRKDYVDGHNVTFGATGTPSTMVATASAISITLGTPSGTTTTAGGTGTMIWTPSSGAFDRAGNAVTAGVVTESGAADREF